MPAVYRTGRGPDSTVFLQQARLFALEVEAFDANAKPYHQSGSIKVSTRSLWVGQDGHTIALIQMAR